jgi:ankyrin repeat protein
MLVGFPRTVLGMEKKKDINKKDKIGITALCYAVRFTEEHTEEVRILLDQGADPNIKDNNETSPLHHSICSGHTNVTKMLLERGANPNIQGKFGSTPLMHISQQTDSTSILLLLEKGADINKKDDTGGCPLHYLISIDEGDSLKILLENGAYPNIEDKTRMTPLHTAILLGRGTTIIKLLLEHGANPTLRNKDNDTVFHLAVSSDKTIVPQYAMCKILAKYKVKKSSKSLIDTGFLKLKNNDGKTAYTLFKELSRYDELTNDDKKIWNKLHDLLDPSTK